VPGGDHLGDEILLVPARLLGDEKARSCRWQEREKLGTAFGRVLELTGRACGQARDIKALLGNIDPDVLVIPMRHREVPSLQIRTRAIGVASVQAAVRAFMTRPAAVTLGHGLGGPKVVRPTAGLRFRELVSRHPAGVSQQSLGEDLFEGIVVLRFVKKLQPGRCPGSRREKSRRLRLHVLFFP